MIDGQLELSFGNGRGGLRLSARQRRRSRAHWWFERMRQLVDRALYWEPLPPPRPEQIWFPGSHRPVGQPAQAPSPSASTGNERQICE